jgi:hypothetical protein
MNPIGRLCDHCGWRGEVTELARCPSEDRYVCPKCWADGFVASVREPLGPLMEAFAKPKPEPRYPKALVDWTVEEWGTHQRIERARRLHEQRQVTAPTTMQGYTQYAFSFMRPEFKVQGRY